jgi:ATP-binding cassette subfamily F protein 3
MPPGLAIAHVSQDLEATDREAIELVLDGDAELRAIERAMEDAERRHDGARLGELHARYEAAGGYDARSRAARLLHGLGFATEDETRPVRAFSGGWRVRLNLAQALMCRSDLLLLDEPTNHLDLDAILWLEEWLRGYRGTLLLIAHDREFLDRVADRIVHIERGGARAYRGNYSAFEEQRAAALAQQAALFARQQREIAHMQSFIDRFRAKASKARQAQSRLKALARMQRIAPAHVDTPLEISFVQPEKLPRPLLALERTYAGYDGRLVLGDVSLTLSPGDRIALLGRNGAGKSTCMKLLAGELPALGGGGGAGPCDRLLRAASARAAAPRGIAAAGAAPNRRGARRPRERAGAARLSRELRFPWRPSVRAHCAAVGRGEVAARARAYRVSAAQSAPAR